MAALQHLAVLAEQGPHALSAAQRGALFDARLRTLGGAAEGGEGGEIAGEVDRVVAPFAGRDHAAVEVQDARQLGAVEGNLGRGAARKCDDGSVQRTARSWLHPRLAPLRRAAAGARSGIAALSSAISALNAVSSVSSFSTQSRLGAQGSSHGVP
jgi:hypothetical protein